MGFVHVKILKTISVIPPYFSKPSGSYMWLCFCMCCVPSLFCNLCMCVCVHCTWLYVVCCKVYTCIKPIIEWLKGPGSDLQRNTLRTHAHGAYMNI